MNDEHEDEEVSVEEITYSNEHLINTLIDLLIEKKIITEAEFEKKSEEMDEE